MLGRLERVELRNIWRSEAIDFTPWLARDENIAILGETLNLDLEVEATERSVGPFRADILCKDLSTNSWVLIENQLERTDHIHLGQLLTYASGLDAVTIIWIAAHFTEEHRSTLDWLNKITDDSFRFFGMEVELWRIGDSRAAPKFNVISKPNDWTKAVAKSARAIDDGQLSDIRALQKAYWSGLHFELERQRGPVSGRRTAQPQNWMNYPVGRTGFTLGTAIHRAERWIRVELYISGEMARAHFDELKTSEAEFEFLVGALEWEGLPEKRDKRIAVYLNDIDPLTTADWPRQHAWLAGKLNQLHRTFSHRVRALGSQQRVTF